MKTATKADKTNTDAARQVKHPPLAKQPQSKEQAAKESGMFLSTDDRWSLAYFDSQDLHCEERELFA